MNDRDDRKHAAVFIACLGSAAHHTLFRTFNFDNDGDRAKVDKIKEAFDEHWSMGEVNVTYTSGTVFHQRVQQTGRINRKFRRRPSQTIAKLCTFEQLEDSLIRDRIIIGIRVDLTRRRLL